ncbi:MAG: sigma-54 dependent transcriptional regulator [Planctomycetes bacterium]|nr:sigma-54 dependent transcriptional regulator [Planctomycetota bacterium]
MLIVEDVRVQAMHLRRILERDGHHVETCERAAAALAALGSRAFDIVLTDLRLPGGDGEAGEGGGLALFRQCREALGEDAPTFVIVTAYGTVESAREALRSGVHDYITKPVDPTELSNLVGNILEYRRLRRENRELSQAVAARRIEEKLIGQSVPFLSMIELAKAAAGSEATILIRGESGTGKELIAELVHAASPRAKGPFVKVNCGAIPEPLLEAELFGHEQGAFTDARQARKGRFELASGGTIFLDEIGEMSPTLQVKLLRVLQERELERLGGQGQVIPLDIRLLAATNRDLEGMIREGSFREDLYYRINVITIHAPPLRERRGDIELLANAFCARFNEKNKKAFKGISPQALELLRRYHWPGNVRELENVIERAVVLGRGEWILPEHLPDPLKQATARRDAGDFAERVLDAGIGLEDFSRLMIQRALEATGGNVSQAARKLGLTRRTLQYRLGKEDAPST